MHEKKLTAGKSIAHLKNRITFAMHSSRRVLRGALRPLLIVFLLYAAVCGRVSPASEKSSVRIVVSGDVQFRSGWDWWSGGLKYRRPVLEGIAAEKADVVVFNGDLVEKGSDKPDWALFDREMRGVLQSTPTFVSSIGNHDLKGNKDLALQQFFGHVTAAKGRAYYSFQRGPVLFLILNSNESLAPGSTQREWLQSELSHVRDDVKYVLLSMHHPMATRSRSRAFTRGHEVLPEHKELARWIESWSGNAHYRILSFSGHVHNYERYDLNGVMFVVSGGSGGRPHVIEREPRDAYTGRGPTYHYCVIEADSNQLLFRMRRFDTGEHQWRDADSFTLKAKQLRRGAGCGKPISRELGGDANLGISIVERG